MTDNPAQAASKANVHHLSLENRVLSASLLSTLHSLSPPLQLRTLDLSGCQLPADADSEQLGPLWCSSLEVLELSRSQLGSADMLLPAICERCVALRVLLVADVATFSDIALGVAVSALPMLSGLDVRWTMTTASAVASASAGRPELSLESDFNPELADSNELPSNPLAQVAGRCPIIAAKRRRKRQTHSNALRAEEQQALSAVCPLAYTLSRSHLRGAGGTNASYAGRDRQFCERQRDRLD